MDSVVGGVEKDHDDHLRATSAPDSWSRAEGH
jgi:hypothetical protein